MASRKAGVSNTHPRPATPHPTTVRQIGRRPNRKTRSPWPWLALAVFILIAGAIALRFASGASSPANRLSAEHQTHDFGQVPIQGGLITAQFPLTVESETLVTELTTS
jgi:hypothetical protein